MIGLCAAFIAGAALAVAVVGRTPPPEAVIEVVELERPPPRIAVPPADPVPVAPDDDLAALVEAHPMGTAFRLLPGVHRHPAVIPRHRQRFAGGPGVVMSGAVVLDPADFTRDDAGHHWIGGQVQEGLAVGVALPGRERDLHPEEVFVDGDRRLRHVGSREALAPGTWYFDYEADRIYLHDDPRTFALVETSVEPFAFGGLAVRDVVVEDVVVEKYASPHYYGALGGSQGSYPTYGWTFRRVTARHNHGAGIAVGPGSVVEDSLVHHNGQIGLVGEGRSHHDGHAAPVVVRGTEIAHNLQLGFDWQHEGGGTKFKRMDAGMLFEGNWVHGNRGPGAWWDVYNHDVVVRDNLVEGNEAIGIYYEIGSGRTRIEGNVVVGNDVGIAVSTSHGVVVRDNVLWDNRDGLAAYHDEVQVGPPFPRGLEDVAFDANEVHVGAGHAAVVAVHGGDPAIHDRVEFTRNTYLGEDDAVRFRTRGADRDEDGWRAAHPADGAVRPPAPPPVARRDAVLAQLAATGRRPPLLGTR